MNANLEDDRPFRLPDAAGISIESEFLFKNDLVERGTQH
jgi:hypothetical protein